MSMLDRRARAVVATVTMSLAISACGGSGPSAAPTDAASTPPAGSAGPTAAARTIDDVCAAAAGTTVTYWSQGDVPNETEYNALFTEAYPEIGVRHIQERAEDVATRLLTEAQAGRTPEGDFIDGSLANLLPLFENDLIADVDFRALGFPENLVYEVNGFQSFRTTRTFGGLMYNSDEVTAEELPDTWTELTSSEILKGAFMSDPRGIALAPLRLGWDEAQFETFVTDLVANLDPVLVRGTSAQITKILAGAYVTGDQGKSHEVDAVAADGAPIAIKYLDVIPAFDIFATIVKDGPAQDAALCYIHFRNTTPAVLDLIYSLEFGRNDDTPSDAPGVPIAEFRSSEDFEVFAEASLFYADALEGQTTIE